MMLYLLALGLVYAYLPVMVKVFPGDQGMLIHREYFFYYTVALFLIINLFTWGLKRLTNPLLMLKRGELVTAWFNVIAPIINIYLSMLLGYIGVINNPLHVSAQGFAYLNYIGPFLILAWIIVFFYLLSTKKSTT